jgi:hypothetical protein
LGAIAAQRAKKARAIELQVNELAPADLDAVRKTGMTETEICVPAFS